MKKSSILFLISILFSIQGYSQCSNAAAVESVRNGNFEAGYLSGPQATSHTYTANGPFDFQSDLDFVGQPPTGYPSACDPRHWSIGDKYMVAKRETFTCSGTTYVNKSWWGGGYSSDLFQDHTSGLSGNGYALLVDLYTYITKNGGTPIAWAQTVSIIPNQTYYFSAFLAKFWNYPATGVADMQVRIIPYRPDGSTGTVTVTALPTSMTGAYNWQQLYTAWTPDDPTYNKVKLQLEYLETSGGSAGLDLVIDDISFINSCQNIVSMLPSPTPNLGADFNLCEYSLPKTLNSSVPTSSSPLRQFSWYSGTSNPQTTLVSNSTTQTTYNITTPGTYRVCLDETGKCAVSSTVVVTESNALSGSDINYCVTSTLGAVTITPSAANSFMTYSWKKGGAAWAGSVNSKTATADGPGLYTITGTHSNGRAACNVSFNITATSNSSVFSSTIGPGPYALCNPSSQTLTSSLTGAGYTYRWYKNGTPISVQSSSSSYVANTAGTYSVNVLINKTGCAEVSSNSVVITNSNPLTPTDARFCPTAVVNLSVSPAVANAYKWYASDNTTVVQAASATSSTYSPSLSAATTYYVEDVRSSSATINTSTSGTGGNNPIKVTFDVASPGVTLVSVNVQRSGQWQGNLNHTVNLYNSSNTLLATSSTVTEADGTTPQLVKTATFGGGAGISIVAGTGYYLTLSGSPGGMIAFSNAGGSNISNIATPSGGGQIFGSWVLAVPSNSCGRVPIKAIPDCTAPVEFVAVNAIRQGNENHINWSTAIEKNASHFIVERSFDGFNFENIGTVQARGTATSVGSYIFIDKNTKSELVYYRLKEVDRDGLSMYSMIVHLRAPKDEIAVLLSNPVRDEVKIQLLSEGDNLVSLISSHGATLFENSYSGSQLVNIKSHFARGVYFLRVSNQSQISYLKFVIE